MRAEHINPFLNAARDVFRTMLSCELVRGDADVKSTSTPSYEISGLIGLSGSCQGMVVVSLGRQTAMKVAETLLGQEITDMNADVIDAVGEITNMIAGAAKSKLEEQKLSIGLPTVICGKNHAIAFPSKSTPISLPFTSSIGPICIDVGMVESPR